MHYIPIIEILLLQWCPPCMRLLPEFRKAARDYNGGVNFGTVDCTIHGDLCQVVSEKKNPTIIFISFTCTIND